MDNITLYQLTKIFSNNNDLRFRINVNDSSEEECIPLDICENLQELCHPKYRMYYRDIVDLIDFDHYQNLLEIYIIHN